MESTDLIVGTDITEGINFIYYNKEFYLSFIKEVLIFAIFGISGVF